MATLVGSVHRMGVGQKTAQLRCGLQQARGGQSERDFHTPQYAIVYIPDGQGWYIDARRRRHEIVPGSFFQRFPSRRHTIELETDSLRCWMAVPCQVFELLSLMGLASYTRPVVYVGAKKRMVREFVLIRDALAACPEHELMSMLMRMQRFLVSLHERGRASRTDEDTAAPITRAMQLLNENLERRIRLPEVARKVGMGYSAFRKQFAEQAGTSPGDYRIRRRIERAMGMLTREQLLVKEIASGLGYPDEYAFSSQFKKMAGVSPREFRRRNS